jgi:hypothetical protein
MKIQVTTDGECVNVPAEVWENDVVSKDVSLSHAVCNGTVTLHTVTERGGRVLHCNRCGLRAFLPGHVTTWIRVDRHFKKASAPVSRLAWLVGRSR